jgi:NAD(P)-dependent dehydrogenase (short-subunit alcohol dehydrogenase family)
VTGLGRAALVTGASSGIGLAVTRALAADGYRVTATARRRDKLHAAVDELRAAGLDVHPQAGDAASEDDIRAVVAAHLTRTGRVDVLVNNAGLGVAAPLQELSTRRVDLQLAVNLRAPLLFYRECTPALLAAGAEHRTALVVNVSSIYGLYGSAGNAVYAATKASLLALTASANSELGPHGVKATTLAPSWVDTPMTDFAKTTVPADSMIRPDDVGEIVRALLRLSAACVVPQIAMTLPGAPGA